MNWTDDAYGEENASPWTDEELIDRGGQCRRLRGTGASTRKRKWKAGSKYMCDTHSEQINELAKALAPRRAGRA